VDLYHAYRLRKTFNTVVTLVTRKLSYRKDNRAMRPSALKIFGSSWICTATFPEISNGLFSDWCYEYAYKIWCS